MIKDISFQKWRNIPDVAIGTRMARMARPSFWIVPSPCPPTVSCFHFTLTLSCLRCWICASGQFRMSPRMTRLRVFPLLAPSPPPSVPPSPCTSRIQKADRKGSKKGVVTSGDSIGSCSSSTSPSPSTPEAKNKRKKGFYEEVWYRLQYSH